MNNKEFVRGVYDEIHAPEELFGKVMDMNKKEAKKNSIMRFAAGAVATLALAFVASNGICYAATGETWVTKAIIYIDGEEQEVEVEMHQDGDVIYGEITQEVDENDTNSVVYSETIPEEVSDMTEISEDDLVSTQDYNVSDIIIGGEVTVTVEDKDGKIYLNVGDKTIDITEDFADGEAKGTVTIDGIDYDYTITGDVNEYDLSISSEQ